MSHGGGAPQVRAAAARRREASAVEGSVAALLAEWRPDAVSVDAHAELLDCLATAVGMRRVLELLVSELDAGTGGLWGPDHLGDGRPHVAETQLRFWVAESARIAKLAIDAGIDERRVAITEEQGRAVTMAIREIIAGLADIYGLGAVLEDKRVLAMVRKALEHARAIEATGVPA